MFFYFEFWWSKLTTISYNLKDPTRRIEVCFHKVSNLFQAMIKPLTQNFGLSEGSIFSCQSVLSVQHICNISIWSTCLNTKLKTTGYRTSLSRIYNCFSPTNTCVFIGDITYHKIQTLSLRFSTYILYLDLKITTGDCRGYENSITGSKYERNKSILS